jgi:hypothetical protein
MSQDTTAADDSSTRHATHLRSRARLLGQLSLTLVLLSLVAVDPVLAQESSVCHADKLQGMIEGFFQLTTGLGIVGLVTIWQADSLMEMFVMNLEKKKGLEHHKRSSLKSAAVLVVLGPLYTVAGTTMGLPLAECINLVPW